MKCKTCAHPQLQAIDLALLTRTHTLEALSQQYGLSVSSLHRHKQHLVDNLDRARDRLRNNQQLGQFLKLNAMLDKVERAVEAADADGDVDRVLRGASTGARIIRQMSRMDVPLELDTVHHIISNPQWLTQASLLPTDPQLLTDLHQTLADIAFSPCPEPEPELAEADDEDYADYRTIPTTGSQQLQTIHPELRTQDSELLHLDSELPHLEPFSATAARQLSATPAPRQRDRCETPAGHQREKSAKIPKKPSFRADNNKQNQSDNRCEKIIALKPQIQNSEPTTQDSELYVDCLIPLKNERYRRGVLY